VVDAEVGAATTERVSPPVRFGHEVNINGEK
jgi:hypothetical protein